MAEISYDHPIPEPGSGRIGFTQTLRSMRKGGSVEVPVTKKPGVYAAAKAAGVKVRMRTTGKGTIRIWRLDDGEPKPFSLDELRTLYQDYVASHSLNRALEILKLFGSSSITEAHSSLTPAKMSELASALGLKTVAGSIFK
jgi:hypothetical protein